MSKGNIWRYFRYRAKTLFMALALLLMPSFAYAYDEAYGSDMSVITTILIVCLIAIFVAEMLILFINRMQDKTLKEYYKRYYREGKKKSEIDAHLVRHGIDSDYLEDFERKEKKIRKAKNFAMIFAVTGVIALVLNIALGISGTNILIGSPVGFVSLEYQNYTGGGCCERFCANTTAIGCYEGNFHPGKNCDTVDSCNIGCCIDGEGYCLSNYLKSNCDMLQYRFYKKECSELMQCVAYPPKESIRKSTGINLIYDPSMDQFYTDVQGARVNGTDIILESDEEYGMRFASVEPDSSYRGTSFKIMYTLGIFEDVKSVKAIIKDGNEEVRQIDMFDDGNHQDANKEDGVFGNIFASSQVNDFTGLKRIKADIIVIDKEDRENTYKDALYFTVVNNVKCMPLGRWNDPDSRIDIIFVGNNFATNDKFFRSKESSSKVIKMTSPFYENEDKINYYAVEETYELPVEDIQSKVQSHCSFFNPSQDILIILDKNEDYCRKVSDGVYTISPKVVFTLGAAYSMDEVRNNLCLVLDTLKGSENDQANALPKVAWLMKENMTFWNGNVFARYMISDDNDEIIEYKVDYGQETYHNNATNSQMNEEIFSMPEGDNMMVIEAIDSDGNSVMSDFMPVKVNTSLNFNINIGSPKQDDMIVNDTMDIKFNVTHNQDTLVDYEYFIDKISYGKGVASIDEATEITLPDITEGSHDLYIKAIDGNQRSVVSVKIGFIIKKSNNI